MVFDYTSLRILETLSKERRRMSHEELRADLSRRGCPLDEGILENSIRNLHSLGLVDIMVLAGGQTEFRGLVAITEKGDRKVRSIVRL
jgi:DNA-binding PadR family transcriptional regulator